MRRSALSLLLILLAAGPAAASGAIECTTSGGEASASLTIGSLPVLAVVGAKLEAGERRWTIGGDDAEGIAVGQAFRGIGEMRIDFTDPNVEEVVAEMRLFTATEGRQSVTAGTMRIADVGAWALTCEGP
ncbi:hypothetical protein [Chelativorans sp. Marseille-P2723]|uniref:hypothetical protein n=1 Tax=Chelativorans sp. Marseille-P2723 TaxID=2709133 RepID=UPI00156FB4AC|nr:hypothetical protein [Chelativorans sp. Marseille-P2723]